MTSHWVTMSLLALSSLEQQVTTSLPDYLRKHAFSAKDLSVIESGEPVVKLIDAENDSETQLLGVVKIRGTPDEFIARYRDIVNFEKGAGVLQSGLFSDPPKSSDLASLTLDPEDVEEIKGCRPGDCDIKLGDGTIEALQRVDWKVEGSVAKAERLARQMIVDFVRGYQEGGNGALGTLHDKAKPLQVKEQFEEMIQSRELLASFPRLYAFLNEYPATGIPGAEEMFYWSRVDFGLKPMIRLNHVVIYEPQDNDGVEYAIASKMLYSSHYFNTGIEMKFLVVRPDSPGAYYLVANNQSRSDGFSGFTGFFAGRKIRGKAREGLEGYLASVKRNLERDGR